MECNHIAVLLKIVPDPDGQFHQDDDKGVTGAHLPQIPSIFDENSLETAIQIKEATGCRVSVLCLGKEEDEVSLKRALAMGADEIILIKSDTSSWDSSTTAEILASAVQQLDGVDIILCGREAADTGAGLVGPYVAQTLKMPFLTLASNITVTEDSLRVMRPCEGGHDEFICHPPILLSITGEANRPHMPSVMKTMKARKTPARHIQAEDLEHTVNGSAVSAQIVSRDLDEISGSCLFIEEGSISMNVDALLTKLKEERVI